MRLTEVEYQALLQRQTAAKPAIEVLPVAKPKTPARSTRGRQNKTEARFQADYLDPRQMCGEIISYGFERITLVLAHEGRGVRYTPDFDVTLKDGRKEFHEIKGGRIWDGSREKFFIAREQYPEFEFHAWQWEAGQWKEIWK